METIWWRMRLGSSGCETTHLKRTCNKSHSIEEFGSIDHPDEGSYFAGGSLGEGPEAQVKAQSKRLDIFGECI